MIAKNADDKLWQITSQTLIDLGFPTDHRGYEYMRCAIVEVCTSPDLSEYITKTLYPKIARKYIKTNPQNVARACRRAIVYACKNGNLLGFTGGFKSEEYPSSTDVINSISQYVKKQYN